MNCTITFRNLDHTEALDNKIRSKSEKLTRVLGPEASMKWVCWVEKNQQIAEVFVTNKADTFIAKAESDDLYKTMDLVLDKISNQIQRHH
ncbi:HPF/RaiA family ribosome-associated protein [Bacteriovorax sp. DB6_IX]|uniref:HPF/RaiA family ribosome-associated protein n=1 Tax=Bacteriovorax sp. DB6_IX TaxID=1353530 RepID=UPI00038A3CB8|nr:HPF/RaiA family ribosome-associated protein [Bacteriovorax sp. DB6_IX]EQC51675.1 putative ribosomal subunit interface protein [Bacteriovorax sp. DB6_IX]